MVRRPDGDRCSICQHTYLNWYTIAQHVTNKKTTKSDKTHARKLIKQKLDLKMQTQIMPSLSYLVTQSRVESGR